MYKLKYFCLNKEEKNKLKYEFYETNYGKKMNYTLTRLLIIGIIGIIFSIYLIITNKTIWDIVTSIILIIASLIFIYESFYLRIKKLNEYLISKNKK